MSLSLISAVTLAYCGMLMLCQGLERHYKQFWGTSAPAGRLRLLRGAGWACLLASFAGCILSWGWAMGPVGWFGMCSLAGLALLLLLPYAPKLSNWLPVIAVPALVAAWVV
ncbi:DUF3325 domain-containing protein [Pseudomonas sp. LRF_L74]|uniref:DUF3325 domain-containing protein n=1 Tax=Pseudomonas sp. LRF_L74 TaxID=3369422 RepID=UPI003F63BB67